VIGDALDLNIDSVEEIWNIETTKRARRTLAQELTPVRFALRRALSQSTKTNPWRRWRMHDSLLSTVGDHFFIGLRPTSVLDERDRALLRDLRGHPLQEQFPPRPALPGMAVDPQRPDRRDP
jgi:hypothetical protein